METDIISVESISCYSFLVHRESKNAQDMIIKHFFVILGNQTPRDCYDVLTQRPNSTSGVYRVYPGTLRRGMDVVCDMDVDGGGWLVSFSSRSDCRDQEFAIKIKITFSLIAVADLEGVTEVTTPPLF